MSPSDESGTDLPSPFSTFPNKEQHTERILGRRGCRESLIVDHTANRRKNSKISAIWQHRQEYEQILALQLLQERNPLKSRWRKWRTNHDTRQLYTFDQLTCPATATQCERVFCAAKRTLTPERNALGATIIGGCECLR
jgi:hypothetical protein